jgi:predicted DNA-binding mobile mystery protein A
MKVTSRTLRRQRRLLELEAMLARTASPSSGHVPADGWISAIREAFGVNRQQLGRLLGIEQSVVRALEVREAKGGATLGALRKAAHALGCDLVYQFVPNAGSFSAVLRARAEAVADTLMEDHGGDALEGAASTLDREALVQQLMAERPRQLWQKDDSPSQSQGPRRITSTQPGPKKRRGNSPAAPETGSSSPPATKVPKKQNQRHAPSESPGEQLDVFGPL